MTKNLMIVLVSAILLTACGNVSPEGEISSQTDGEISAETELSNSVSDGEQTDSSVSEESGYVTPASHMIEVENIMQNPELPMGCEIVSLTIVLNHLGIDVEKTYMAEYYLPKKEFYRRDGVHYGGDPYKEFPGDPKEKRSTGCFAPVIVNSANKFFSDIGLNYNAVKLGNIGFSDILHKYIDNDIPVIIWVTSKELHEIEYHDFWQTESGKMVVFPIYQHCVVLQGYDTKAGKVMCADPLEGNVEYDLKLFRTRYNQLGAQAVIIDTSPGQE